MLKVWYYFCFFCSEEDIIKAVFVVGGSYRITERQPGFSDHFVLSICRPLSLLLQFLAIKIELLMQQFYFCFILPFSFAEEKKGGDSGLAE